MLEQEIQRKREELNESIENNKEYEDVYRLSVELDDLIDEFYRKSREKEKTRNILKAKKGLRKVLYIA